MCLDRSTLTLSWGEGPRPLPRAHFPLTIFSPKNSFPDRTLSVCILYIAWCVCVHALCAFISLWSHTAVHCCPSQTTPTAHQHCVVVAIEMLRRQGGPLGDFPFCPTVKEVPLATPSSVPAAPIAFTPSPPLPSPPLPSLWTTWWQLSVRTLSPPWSSGLL